MRGTEFRSIRKHLGLSLDEFALELGYSGTADGNRHTIKRLETGKRSISPQTARLAWMLKQFGPQQWPENIDETESEPV